MAQKVRHLLIEMWEQGVLEPCYQVILVPDVDNHPGPSGAPSVFVALDLENTC